VKTTAQRLAELEPSHFWFAGRDDLVSNLTTRFGATGPVVDIGCGTGAFARRLSRQGARVVALDQELHRGPVPGVPAVAGDAVALPLRSGSVATVLLRDVLEHVDDGAALDECRRVLRPGGLLVALVPAWPALWSCRDERAGHRRRYTRATLVCRLRAGGFEVLELRGYQLALLPLIATSRVAARRRGLVQLDREEHPPASVNALFTRINQAEASLARFRWPRPPTGSTLAAVARLPTASGAVEVRDA
jgi:SAM-dependent methyltransferase